MHRVFWIIAILVVSSVLLFGRVQAGSFRSFSEIWEGPSGAIVVTGLEPQIQLIEQVAGSNGWGVDCKRPDGQLTLVQLTPSFWARFSEEPDWQSELSLLATSTAKLRAPSGGKAECGAGNPMSSSRSLDPEGSQDILIGYGTDAELEPVFRIAKLCGLSGLQLRPLTDPEKAWVGDLVSPDRQGVGVVLDNSNKNEYVCFGALANYDSNQQ